MEKDLVIIFSSEQEYQISIARSLLIENNIESYILNQHDSVIPSIGIIELYVHKTRQQTAEQILKKLKN